MIDRRFPGVPANYVGVDDRAVGALATEHLIEMGARRIAHLRGPENSPGIERLRGYREAMAKHNLPILPNYVSEQRTVDVQSRESGAESMKQLLALKPRPDAVFCYNDPMAMGAIHSILESGLRVPEDIAVIGSGNIHYAPLLRVPLSSIDQHTEEIGERAARLALALVEAKTPPRPRSIVLQPSLVVRASSANKRPHPEDNGK